MSSALRSMIAGRRIPVALDAHAARVPRQRVRRRQLADAAVDGLGRRNVAVEQKIAHRALIDLRCAQHHQRLEFGGERNAVRQQPVVQGLDPQPIAGEQQTLGAAVPGGEGEHADQSAEAGGSLGCEKTHQHFGVAARAQGPGQSGAQALVIVELAVVGQHLRAEHHGLMAAVRQIQNRQPAVRQGDARLAPHAFAVGTAMPQALRHAAGDLGARPRTDNSRYTTHGRQSSAAAP